MDIVISEDSIQELIDRISVLESENSILKDVKKFDTSIDGFRIYFRRFFDDNNMNKVIIQENTITDTIHITIHGTKDKVIVTEGINLTKTPEYSKSTCDEIIFKIKKTLNTLSNLKTFKK